MTPAPSNLDAISLAYSPPATSSRWCDLVLRFAEKFRFPLLFLLIAGYAAAFNGLWQIEPDSALYLALGKNIATGHGYTYHGQPHDLAYPGLPYALALFFKIFRNVATAICAADLFMVFCGLATLALTYRLVLLYSDRAHAVLITFLVGISHIFTRYCFEIMTDVPFLMGAMGFLAGYEAIFRARIEKRGIGRWYDWLILFLGLAVATATRPTMIGLVAATILVILWQIIRGRLPAFWALIGVAVIAAAIALFIMIDPRHGTGGPQSYEQWFLQTFTHHLDQREEVIDKNLQYPFFDAIARSITGMPLMLGWLNCVVGSSILIAALAMFRKRPLWGMWIAITLVMLIAINSQDRNVLQILPLLVIGCWEGLCRVNRKVPGIWGNILFALIFIGIVGANSVQFVTTIGDQHRHPFLDYYKQGRFVGYVEMAHDAPKLTGPDDLILCPVKFERILTFLSDRLVVEEYDISTVDLSAHNLFVALDPDDAQFRDFLDREHIHTASQPIATWPRQGRRAPLSLYPATINGTPLKN